MDTDSDYSDDELDRLNDTVFLHPENPYVKPREMAALPNEMNNMLYTREMMENQAPPQNMPMTPEMMQNPPAMMPMQGNTELDAARRAVEKTMSPEELNAAINALMMQKQGTNDPEELEEV